MPANLTRPFGGCWATRETAFVAAFWLIIAWSSSVNRPQQQEWLEREAQFLQQGGVASIAL
jgi:hypothetical protein